MHFKDENNEKSKSSDIENDLFRSDPATGSLIFHTSI